MTSQSKSRTLVVTRRFEHSQERVFDAWIDPATARKFLFTMAGGEIIRADIDARPGGKFLFIDRRDTDEFKGDIEHIGEYLEIERPRRLVFTFGVPQFSPEMTRVTIEIVPAGSGCELTLTHEDVPPEWAERTQEGWTMILGALEKTLSAR